MPIIVCPTCATFNEEIFRSLGSCPACGQDLLPRVQARDRMRVRRSADHIAHEYEIEYGAVPILESGLMLRHEKKDLIEYTRGLIGAAGVVLDWLTEGDFGVGFLTGSADLMWLLRRLYPNTLGDRIRYVPGLAHRGQNAEQMLGSTLNDLLARGMRRLFVVDEVVSGTQFQTNARAIERWARNMHSTAPFHVLLVGIQPTRSTIGFEELCRLIRTAKRHNRPRVSRFTVRLVTVPELLASDGRGRLIKGLRKNRGQPGYTGSRWRALGYLVACKREVHTHCAKYEVLATAGSTDQTFGNAIWRLLRPSTSNATSWPDADICDLCGEALSDLRHAVANLPPDGSASHVSLGSLSSIRERARRGPLVVRPWR